MVKKLIGKVFFNIAFIVLLFVSLFPFYYCIVTSFKSGTDIFRVSYNPFPLDWGNYIGVLREGVFVENLWNSVLVSFFVVLLSLLLGVGAAYSLARVSFRGRALLLLLILSTSMFPQVAVLSGMFELVQFFDLFNTLYALILTYMLFAIPFTVWVLTTFMRDFPIELERSAMVDGASTLTIIGKIILPVMWPSLVSVGLLTFIAAWNEFLFALTFVFTDAERTVPVAIALLSGATEFEVPWGKIMAASVIVTLPLVVLVLIFQRKIISGLTAGAVKG